MKTKIRRLFSTLLLISVISLFNCSNSENMKKPLLKIRLTYDENIITPLFLADRANEARAVLPDLNVSKYFGMEICVPFFIIITI